MIRPAARPTRGRDSRLRRPSFRCAGKILNVEKAQLVKVLDNEEIRNIFKAIGVAARRRARRRHQAPLRQARPDDRCRRRRQPHPHAAVDVHLSAHCDRWSNRAASTSPSRRSTASRSKKTVRYVQTHEEMNGELLELGSVDSDAASSPTDSAHVRGDAPRKS